MDVNQILNILLPSIEKTIDSGIASKNLKQYYATQDGNRYEKMYRTNIIRWKYYEFFFMFGEINRNGRYPKFGVFYLEDDSNNFGKNENLVVSSASNENVVSEEDNHIEKDSTSSISKGKSISLKII